MVSAHRHSGARAFCSGALPPRPCGPAPTRLVVARFRRLRLLNRGRMRFAHGIRPPPLGRPRCLLRGFAPAALRSCPHGLGRGSVSSASPPQPWADALRALYPPTATRAPALFAQGLCPRGPAGLPHGLGRGSVSSASPPPPWADA